jgi:hypothetical protein
MAMCVDITFHVAMLLMDAGPYVLIILTTSDFPVILYRILMVYIMNLQ